MVTTHTDYCDKCKHLAAGLPEIPEPLVRP